MPTVVQKTGYSSGLIKSPMVIQKVILYRFKRLFIPLWIGFSTTFVSFATGYPYPIMGFFAFIASGLFLDWWYFEHKKYKDSNRINEQICQSLGITGEQIDCLNQYVVKARKVSFSASISITAGLVMYSKDFEWQATLIVSYMTIISLMIILGVSTKKIISPYILERATGNQARYESFLNPSYRPASNDLTDSQRDNFNHPLSTNPLGSPIHVQCVFDPESSPNCFKDSYSRFDYTSSAAYWPGGVLDPNRYNTD